MVINLYCWFNQIKIICMMNTEQEIHRPTTMQCSSIYHVSFVKKVKFK